MSKIKSTSVSNETNGTDDIQLMVSRIKQNMEKLKGNTNLDEIVKEKNEVGLEIKKAEQVLTELNNEFEKPLDECTIDETFNFETCFKEIETLYVASSNDTDTIKKQIEKFNLLRKKVRQCIMFLESKKMTVTKVD